MIEYVSVNLEKLNNFQLNLNVLNTPLIDNNINYRGRFVKRVDPPAFTSAVLPKLFELLSIRKATSDKTK